MNKANDNVSGLATYAFWPAVHFCISRGLYSPITHIFFHSLILFVKQKSNLIYLCLLPSSATVKMDNEEFMENARYAMNDDTAGFINQMTNRNTSRKTEYDLK